MLNIQKFHWPKDKGEGHTNTMRGATQGSSEIADWISYLEWRILRKNVFVVAIAVLLN